MGSMVSGLADAVLGVVKGVGLSGEKIRTTHVGWDPRQVVAVRRSKERLLPGDDARPLILRITMLLMPVSLAN